MYTFSHIVILALASQPLVALEKAFFNFYFSEQGTPDEPAEKPRRRKKPKTPEPGVDQERAKENLGFENEAALDVEDVSTDMHV